MSLNFRIETKYGILMGRWQVSEEKLYCENQQIIVCVQVWRSCGVVYVETRTLGADSPLQFKRSAVAPSFNPHIIICWKTRGKKGAETHNARMSSWRKMFLARRERKREREGGRGGEERRIVCALKERRERKSKGRCYRPDRTRRTVHCLYVQIQTRRLQLVLSILSRSESCCLWYFL